MKKLTIVSILAAGILAAPALSAWDQVIDFDTYDVGTTKDPEAPIADLWNITRDEGYQGGRTEGFATLTINEIDGGHKIFNFGTGGFGYSWGHTFGGINLDEPITGQGTFYAQFSVEGTSFDWNMSLSDLIYEPLAEPDEENPWGYSGASDWGHHKATIRNAAGVIGVRDGGGFANSQFEFVPGAWYEMWMVVDVPQEVYTVYLRSEQGGIPEQTAIEVEFEGDIFDNYYFRTTAAELNSIVVGQVAGSPAAPTLGHLVWLNGVAFDSSTHNLTDPGIEVPDAIEARVIIFGFDAVGDPEWNIVDAFNYLGTEVYVGSAPYVYNMNNEFWMYVPDLWEPATEEEVDTEGNVVEEAQPGTPKEPTYNFAATESEWVYIYDSPFTAGQWEGDADMGTWVYATEGGWAYILNSAR